MYVPTKNRSYVAINTELFSKYVGDELGKVYDFYIVEFWKDYHHVDNFHLSFNVPNVEENVCPQLASPQPAPGPIQYSN